MREGVMDLTMYLRGEFGVSSYATEDAQSGKVVAGETDDDFCILGREEGKEEIVTSVSGEYII